MASTSTSTRGEFERQRGELIKEIAESFEHVLANINKLNRNLEAVITVGNEFSSVEALWSTFENVMGKEEEGGEEEEEGEGEGTGGNDGGANADGEEGQAEPKHEEADAKAESQ